MHILIPWKPYAKFQNDRYRPVRGVPLTRSTHCLYIEGEKWLFTWKKWQKCSNNYTQNTCTFSYMKRTYAKFQNNGYKTVRGVALTKGTHSLYIEGEKWLSSQYGKSNKKQSNNYIQTTCTSSYHEENTREVSKWSVQMLRARRNEKKKWKWNQQQALNY